MNIDLGPNGKEALQELFNNNGEVSVSPKNASGIHSLYSRDLIKKVGPVYTLTKMGYLMANQIPIEIHESYLHLTISKIDQLTEFGMRQCFLITKNKPTKTEPGFVHPFPVSGSVNDLAGPWNELKYELIRQLRKWFDALNLNAEAADTIQLFFQKGISIGEHRFFSNALSELPTLDLGDSCPSWQNILDKA